MIPCYLGGLNPPPAIFLYVWISGVAPPYLHHLEYRPHCYLSGVCGLFGGKDSNNSTDFESDVAPGMSHASRYLAFLWAVGA